MPAGIASPAAPWRLTTAERDALLGTEALAHQDATSPVVGTLAWYDACIDRLAAAEKTAIRTKLSAYGLDAADTPFALLQQAALRLGCTLEHVLHVWAARQLDAPLHRLPPDVARARWLDLLGYAMTALALLEASAASPSQP